MKAGAIIDGDGADGNVTSTVVNNTSYDHLYTLLVGTLNQGDNGAMVEGFALPYLAPGQTVSGASISFYLTGTDVQGNGPNYNIDLYGLKRVSTSSGAPVVADWYVGGNDTANTLLNAGFVTPTTPLNHTCSYTGANLASFVNSQYANSAFSGLSLNTPRYIFFRINANSNVQNNGLNNYIFASARNPTRTYHPLLSLTLTGGISNMAGRLQFSFNLPENATTSAGVYSTTTGALLRTLWNNVQYQAGTNYGVWDGNGDNGSPLPTGTNYQIKLIYHNVQYVWDGTVGNTSTAQSGVNVYAAFGKIHDMSVAGNTAYYAVGYNENSPAYHSFTVGSPQVPVPIGNAGNGPIVDSFSSIYYVAADSTRTYWAKTYGGFNGADTFVVAMNNSNGAFYVFPQGQVPSGPSIPAFYTSCVDYDTTANQPNGATGLAVQQGATGDLFVSHGNLNIVRVFDKVSGASLGSFAVTNPGRMSVTANGDVWVISYGTTPSVSRYTFANGKATLDQTLTGFSNPAGVGVSADNSLVLVSDGGTSQQVKAFTNATGVVAGSNTPIWTYGSLGGLAANGPATTSNNLNFNVQQANTNIFSNEAFIAFQPDNTFWLEDNGNSRILHFSISGSTLTYIEQISFNDASYRATVDLSDPTRVFNNFLEYSVNYSLPLGGTNGSWSMVRNWACGLPNDSTHYYYGLGNGFINVVTLSNGHTYGFLNNFAVNSWDLYELPASGPARFTGYSYTDCPRIYQDGTLRFNSSNIPNSSTASLNYYSQPLTGFDSSNNPMWGSPTSIASTTLNSATDPMPWTTYPLLTEITASGIAVDFGPNEANSGYHLGGLKVGGSTWQWHSSPSVNGVSWFPQDGRFDIGDGVQYAGNYACALGRDIIYGYHGELWSSGEANQWLDYYDNGLMVGRFGTYADVEFLSGQGAVNGVTGNAFSWALVKAPSGSLYPNSSYIYSNVEAIHGGTIRWRVDGWDGITEMDGTGAVGGTVSLSANTAGPSVTMTSPPTGTIDSNGTSLTLSAQAAGSGASITSVQFLDGATSLGTVTSAPFSLNYSGLSAGSHVLTAVAIDSNGLTGTSTPVNVTITGDGTSAPPPAPVALSSGNVSAQSVTLNWTEPSIGTTSSTIGQIISFQCDSTGDTNALKSTDVAGATAYASANFNLLGQFAINPTVANELNSAGTTIPSMSLYCGMQSSNTTNSTQSLTGTAQKLFGTAIQTYTPGIEVGSIPYARYDLVVYSLPPNISNGAKTASVTVGNGLVSGTVQQSFTKLPTGYTIGSVPFGTSSSVTDCNVVVFQGLTLPAFTLQGTNISAFQIVERPYDQGTPASYTIERATGTNGTFVPVGTASGSALTFTDTSSLSAGTTYQYEIQAVNSYGTSAFSNIVSVATPAATTTSFSAWQSEYFTPAQLADPTISGATADPYGSGVPNLLAYALQLNPATARPTDVPNPVITNGHLTVTYFVPNVITDVTYIVEVSTDLVNWNSGTNYTQVISSVASATGTTITVQDALPTTAQKQFMRLRVTQN